MIKQAWLLRIPFKIEWLNFAAISPYKCIYIRFRVLLGKSPSNSFSSNAERFSKMEWLRNEPAEVERTFSVRLDAFLKDDPERHTFNDHAWKNAPCAIRVHSFKVDEEEMVETRQKNGSRRNDNNNNNNNTNRSVGSEKHNKSSSSTNSSSNSSRNGRTSDCWGLTAAVLIETAKIVFDKEPEFERDCVEGASIWDLVPNKDGSGVELRPGVSKM